MNTVVFRGIGRDDIAVSDEVAESIKAARMAGENRLIETSDGMQFETKDVKFVRSGNRHAEQYPCSNDCGKDYHTATEICSKQYTGKCVTCQKALWERDREYSVFKWGKPMCREHSP